MTLDWSCKPCVYTVPPGVSFVETLAHGLCDMAGSDPLELARMRVLLPTRRAARSLRDAFLRITEGKPLLLPQLHPIGDVDDEELSLLLSGMDDDLSLPPAIAPLRRQFMLTRLIAGMGDYSHGLEQDMMLAAALGRLMDQVYTEDLDLAHLPALVDVQQFSAHWQISLDFLSILSEYWPRILQENGVIDSADRRNRLLKKLSQHWRDNPPSHPIIAAGSTGSIPATAELLSTIAGLPQGCIVLPGLDQSMEEESWNALSDTHPQATLRHLLSVLNVARNNVQLWPYYYGDYTPAPQRLRLASELMRPAETAGKWQSLKEDFTLEDAHLAPIERYDCAHPQEEAMVIALALRQSLEQSKTTTAALITPDRRLARRVAMVCRRWNIAIDDSAGVPLPQTDIGVYLQLCLNVMEHGMKPVSMLSFCKHIFCRPATISGWRGHIRDLDKLVLRGSFFETGMAPYYKMLRQAGAKKRAPLAAENVLSFIEEAFRPLSDLEGLHSFETWCRMHLKVAETFSLPDILWAGEAGDAASAFFAEIEDQASLLPEVTFSQYRAILEQAMKNIAVRPAFGLHPRLMILGQLEARLVEADLMILGSLNENSWPPDAGTDPWMSRPMRKKFGLPSLERSIGLSAHDFAQAFCAQKVVLTRAVRADGAPTVPSRWLQRLDTVLQAAGKRPEDIRQGPLLDYARAIDHTDVFKPYERPAPTPPVRVRPRSLSATQVETWMQDPYSLYAKKILRLTKLDPLERPFDAAARGSLMHTTLDRFVAAYPDDMPSHAGDTFLTLAKEEMEALPLATDLQNLWQPRLHKIAGWLITAESEWRQNYKPEAREIEGRYEFSMPGGPFILTARADRIDLSRDGTAGAVIDYKSGSGAYSAQKLKDGFYPQLPLEALILEQGGYAGMKAVPVDGLAYWMVTGSGDGGKKQVFADPAELIDIKAQAEEGLKSLVEAFDKEGTAYISLPHPARAPRFNDYEHLARVREWTALDDQGEDAA